MSVSKRNGGEDDEPVTQFSEDFGFGYYDHDFVDTNSSGDPRTVEELLGQCSFSTSYIKEAVAEARKRGLDRTSFVFLLYRIAYDPEKTGVRKSDYMKFLGSFRYDSNAPSVHPFQTGQ